MSKKDRVPAEDLAAFVESLRLMSEYGSAVLDDAAEEVLSTNFTSGVRGIELVYKTIAGLAGSAKTAPAWDKLEPLMQKYNPPKESGSAKQIVSEGKQAVRQTRKGRSKE